MIPVLFDANETQFNSMGIGALADAISCLVHEARNGAFELTLEYPVDAPLFAELTEDRIIKAKANDNANMDPQLFRVYKSGKPLNGQCTFYAEHITGELAKNPITHASVTNGTAQQFGQSILSNTVYAHRFTFVSGDTTVASSDLLRVPAAQALVGIEGSLIDRWRGELTRDNFVIREEQNRGEDTGIIIEYGKNLTDASQEKAIDETYTSIYPYATVQVAVGEGDSATTESQVIELPEKVVESPYVGNYAYGRCLPIDLSGDDVTDEASLRSKAQVYVNQSDFGKPKVTLTINFIQLWQTEEYKNIAPLEHVNLCDWVTVRFKKLGIDAKVKVIDGVFDSLVEKWTSMELGDAKTDWQSSVQSSINATNAIAQQAIQYAGQAIINADGTITFYSPTEPTGNIKTGSMWFKLVNGDYTEMWRYNGVSWDRIKSKDANDALNAANQAMQSANGKAKVWRQASEPTEGMELNDMWFRKNADGTETTFIYDGTKWDDPTDSGVKAAQDQANTAVATADAASVQASNALNTANSASGQAATAINTANSANSAAQAAQSTASSAASQASSAWNNAQTAINNAQSALDAYNNMQIGGRNLIVSSDVVDGFINDSGELASWNGAFTTDFIQTVPNKKMIFQALGNDQTMRVAYYDGQKNFLRRLINPNENGKIYIFTVPSDVLYIRFGGQYWQYGYFKVEIGNKPTDWSPAPEDVQVQIDNINGKLTQKVSQNEFDTLAGTVSSQSTQISQNQQDIAFKANKDYVDTINQTVQSHSAEISTNAQAITQKADSSTVNALTGRVSTAEATLTTQANQIAARITSQDADSRYATQTALTATSSSLTSQITQTQGSVNDLRGVALIDRGNAGTADWNTLTTPGSYAVGSPVGANFPSGAYQWGTLIVSKSNGGLITQTYIPDGYSATQYLRTKFYDNDWRPWKSAEQYADSRITQTATSLQTEINAKVSTDTYNSKISQLSNDINARVVKNDVVHQINISTEGILIDGSKTHITGQTTIDNAVITNAMIASIDIGKATTGTLDANRIGAKSVTVDKLDVVNLAAISADLGWVTAGTINGVTVNGVNINGSHISGSDYYMQTGAQQSWIDGNGLHLYNSDTDLDFHFSNWFGIKKDGDTILGVDQTGLWRVYRFDDTAVNHTVQGGTYINTNITSGTENLHMKHIVDVINGVNVEYHEVFLDPVNGLWMTGNCVFGERLAFYNDGTTGMLHTDPGAFDLVSNGAIRLGIHPDYVLVGAHLEVDGDASANSWNINSLEELKTDINEYDDSALSVVNSTDIYFYKYKSDVEKGVINEHIGPIIGDGYSLPDSLLSSDKKHVDDHSAVFLAYKAIQELTALHQQDLLKIVDLESRLSVAESKIASLLEAA